MIREKAALKRDFDEEVLAHRVKMNHKMHEHLTSAVKKLHNEHEARKRQQDKRVESMKKRLEQEKGMISRIRNQLNTEMRKVRQDSGAYRLSLKQRLEKQKQDRYIQDH